MPEEIREKEEAVAEESTPETPVEAVEQRTDDYEALKRILEERFDELASMIRDMKARVDGMAGDVEAASTIDEGAIIIGTGVEPDDGPEDGDEDLVDAIMAGELTLEDILNEQED